MRSIGLAAAVAAAVAGIGLTLQTSGLPTAAPGRVDVVNAVRWLERYRYAASTFELGGRRVHGRCLHGWFAAGRRLSRGTDLLLGDGLSVEAVSNRLVVHGHRALPPLSALELAGCTRILGPRLASLAVDAPAVTVGSARVGDKPALALHAGRLTLFVARHTDRPLGVEVHGLHSSIDLVRLTPSRLDPFEDRA